MITEHCFGAPQWDLSDTEAIFVQNVLVLLKLLIPVAISVYTWKVCRTERDHQRPSMLGLDTMNGKEKGTKILANKGTRKINYRNHPGGIRGCLWLVQKLHQVGRHGDVAEF